MQAGHSADLSVSQTAPSRELLLDLLECLPSRLGHEEEGEQGRQGHDAREYVEHVGRADHLHHAREGLGDDEGAGPVQGRDDGRGRTPDLDRQGLPHEEPRNGAPSQRESHDVDHEADEGQPRQVIDGRFPARDVIRAVRHARRHIHVPGGRDRFICHFLEGRKGAVSWYRSQHMQNMLRISVPP